MLEDFDTVFSNKFYDSHLDDICELIRFLNSLLLNCIEGFASVTYPFPLFNQISNAANVNSSSIAAAASLLARSLYVLASDTKNLSTSALAAVNVNVSLVEELMGCLLSCEPGLSCELVKNYIAPSSTCPSHYVGVILDEPSSTPPLEYVSDVSRFVWNFLADRTSVLKGQNTSSACSQDCSNEGGVCIRAETDGKGVCVVSTTRYLASQLPKKRK